MSQALAIIEAEDPKSVLQQAKSMPGYHALKRAGFELTANHPLTQQWIRPAKDLGTWFVVVERSEAGLVFWSIRLFGSGKLLGQAYEGYGVEFLERQLRYLCLTEAEDPKSTFHQAVSVPPPPPDLLSKVVAAKEQYLGKDNEWITVHTNQQGETFCYGGFTKGKREHVRGKNSVVATLLFFDRHKREWVGIEPGTFAEAEDPKSVLRAASALAAPSNNKGKEVSGGVLRTLCSRYPVLGVYIWKLKQAPDAPMGTDAILQINFRNYGLIRQEWACFGVLAGALLRWRNLEGAPLWINGEAADKVSRSHPTLKQVDAEAWQPHVAAPPVEEARKKKKEPEAPVTEDPKAFFQRMISTGKAALLGKSQAYEQVLQYMPDDFKRAFRQGTYALYKQDDFSFTDNWPSYDDDNDEEGRNPWSEVFYYFDYYTDEGKIYIVAMQGDMDGDHDGCDEAEIGTPEAAKLEKEYGSEGYFKAMASYWEWVAERGQDPLGYIRSQHPRVNAKKTFIAGFVREGDRLRIWAIRNVTNPPSPPAVEWPALKEKAADPDWQKALEYCLLDPEGFTSATEAEIVNEGGKWNDKGQLIIRFSWEDQEQAGNEREYIVAQANRALEELRRER